MTKYDLETVFAKNLFVGDVLFNEASGFEVVREVYSTEALREGGLLFGVVSLPEGVRTSVVWLEPQANVQRVIRPTNGFWSFGSQSLPQSVAEVCLGCVLKDHGDTMCFTLAEQLG